MYKKKSKQNKVVTIIVIILVGILLFGVSYIVVRKKKSLNPIESFIKDGGLFIQKILLKPFQLWESKLGDQEIQKLKEKASASEALKVKNDELEYQILELKKTLELNTVLSDRLYLNATVINRNMDYWYQTVTIDKGKHNGIKEGMPVVVSEGVIGMIGKVSNFNSTVQLLTAEQLPHKISVKIEVNKRNIYGLLTGYDYKRKLFQVEGIAENTEIPVGSVVTTTGLGEEMPAGLIIGYVKNITTDNFDLAKLVEVESKVNFDALHYITVLKRKDAES